MSAIGVMGRLWVQESLLLCLLSFNWAKPFNLIGAMNLKKSVEFNPAENIQHKFDKPIGGMS
jgi:hypothetical protein